MNSKRLKVFCKNCGVELTASTKVKSCGCSNMTTISTDKISAVDLSLVVVTEEDLTTKDKPVRLTSEDRAWQEKRRARKVRRLSYEVR